MDGDGVVGRGEGLEFREFDFRVRDGAEEEFDLTFMVDSAYFEYKVGIPGLENKFGIRFNRFPGCGWDSRKFNIHFPPYIQINHFIFHER